MSAEATLQRRAGASHVEKALDFLLEAREPDGWWRDFRLAPGGSDEWVTGYVGGVLAALGDARARRAAVAAWVLLEARSHRSSGRWGYNFVTPGDADSTGWCVKLADAVGAGTTERAARGRAALHAHYGKGGGVSTYHDEGPIRAFVNAPAGLSFDGWCGPHTCVTAALTALPELRHALRPFLMSAQHADGGWRAYWWHDDEYATALAAEGLAACEVPADAERISSSVGWARRRLQGGPCVRTSDHPDGSPFATAWCLRLLLLGRRDPEVAAEATVVKTWLTQCQRQDGSWGSSARLRVPLPDDLAPNDFRRWQYDGLIEGSIVFDRRRVFTTATVLATLALAEAC